MFGSAKHASKDASKQALLGTEGLHSSSLWETKHNIQRIYDGHTKARRFSRSSRGLWQGQLTTPSRQAEGVL